MVGIIVTTKTGEVRGLQLLFPNYRPSELNLIPVEAQRRGSSLKVCAQAQRRRRDLSRLDKWSTSKVDMQVYPKTPYVTGD